MSSEVIIIDVETTGIASYDRIISFAAIRYAADDLPIKSTYLIFNPGKSSHPGAFAKHKLPDWWLRFQPPFEGYACDLKRLLESSELVVGHNVDFDISQLNHEFEKAGLSPLSTPAFCTMSAFSQRVPNSPRNLDACLRHIGLSRTDDRHDALEDAFLTLNLYRWLIDDTIPLKSESLPIQPLNEVEPPKEVLWASAVDLAKTLGQVCPECPKEVRKIVSDFGIDVSKLSDEDIRIALAAMHYASTLELRTPEQETPEQIRDLVLALSKNSEFHEALIAWSEWAWGRRKPMVRRDELRAWSEQFLWRSANDST